MRHSPHVRMKNNLKLRLPTGTREIALGWHRPPACRFGPLARNRTTAYLWNPDTQLSNAISTRNSAGRRIWTGRRPVPPRLITNQKLRKKAQYPNGADRNRAGDFSFRRTIHLEGRVTAADHWPSPHIVFAIPDPFTTYPNLRRFSTCASACQLKALKVEQTRTNPKNTQTSPASLNPPARKS